MPPRSSAASGGRNAAIIRHMRALWKKIVRSKAVSVMSLAALVLALGGALRAYAVLGGASGGSGGTFGTAGTPLILHYNDLLGVTAVGGIGVVAFMGIFGAAAVLLNFFVALELDARDRFLGKLAAAATLVFAALLFIAFAAIMNVN